MEEQINRCECYVMKNSRTTTPVIGVAAIAPWFRLHLPSCGPGFESQAHHLCFFQLLKL